MRTMKEMMDSLNDSKKMEQSARYENARIAISEGYRHAAKMAQGLGPELKSYVDFARGIAKELEKDLNDTLGILNEPKPS